MVVVDTGALLALIDRDEAHHEVLRAAFDRDRDSWIVPWAVLPEVDYLIATKLGSRTHDLWTEDLADGLYPVHWGDDIELSRARQIQRKYKSLKLGLVDTVVMTVAELLGASAIATLDLRHFGAVKLQGSPKLLPRDLPGTPEPLNP